MPNPFVFAARLTLLALLVGCMDTPTPPVTDPAIAFRVSTSELSLAKGSSGSVSIVAERIGGYTGKIDFDIVQLPVGITATFGSASLGSTALNSLLTINALPAASAGSYTLRVRARGTSVDDKTVDITLAITIPDLALTSPSAATVTQAATTTATISVERLGGYTGSVTLSAIGLPRGVTASFKPVVIAFGSTSSVLTLTAANVALLGTASATVRAFADGIETKQSPLSVTVTPAATPAIVLNATVIAGLPGTTAQATITIGRSGVVTSPVSVTAEGALPAGVNWSVNPTSTTGDSVVLSIQVPVSTPVATTDLTLRATAAGLADATAPLTLSVMQPPGIQINVATPVLTIVRGSSGSASLGYTRLGGYSEAVTVSVMGAPAGVTMSPPPFGTGASAVISVPITVAANVPVGVYSIVVRGVGSGVQAEATITLTVTN